LHTQIDFSDSAIRMACADWLNTYNWDWWATLGFRFMVVDTINAKRYFLRFVKSLGLVDLSYFLVVENFRFNHGVHLHCLLSGVLHLRYKDVGQLWFSKYGYAHIQGYQKGRGANHYLTKYVTKASCDWDVHISNSKQLTFKGVRV